MLQMRSITATAAFALIQALVGASVAGAAEPTPPHAVKADSGDDQRFDVEAYDVDGNSLLDPLDIEKAVYAHLGPGRSKSDIEGARQALEEVYHGRGYDSVVVEIPPQTVADKIVRLHVVETTVGRLRVTGTRFYSIEDVKRQTPAMQEGAIPNFHAAEAQIAQLNREPGRQVTPLVQPGALPGTVDIDLKVTEQEPVHASVELNNDHPADTTPLRLTANIRYDNLWQMGHTASFSYAVAPEDRAQSEVFAGSYLAPLMNTPWSVLVYGYHSNSNVATLGDTTVLGKGYDVGLRAITQLAPIGPVSESLSVGFDFKHAFQQITAASAKAAATVSAVDYWPLNAVYSLQYDTTRSNTRASFGVTAGVRGADRADYVFSAENRFDARGNFIHVNVDLDQTNSLPLGLATNLHLAGQIANEPLLSGEEFAAGGLSSVRGYRQSSAIGDNGVSLSTELRSPLITFAPRHLIDDWRVFGFGDAADTWVILPTPGQRDEFPLYSAGLGTRFLALDHVNGSLVVGVPLAAARGSEVGRVYTLFDLKVGF